MQFRQEVEQLPTAIEDFPYKSLYDPQEGKLHFVSGGSSSLHIIFDIARELSLRPYGADAPTTAKKAGIDIMKGLIGFNP